MIPNALTIVNQLNIKHEVFVYLRPLLSCSFSRLLAMRLMAPFTLLDLRSLHILSLDSALLLFFDFHFCLFER